MRRWAAAATGLVLVTLVLSGDTPWRYTLFGLVSPPDFAQDLAAARVFMADRNPYEDGIARTHAELMKAPEHKGYPYFPHPPLLFLLVLPLAGLTLAQAAGVWFSVSIALLFLLAVLLAQVWSTGGRKGPPGFGVVLLIYAALLLWPPVQYNLAKGQWSILVALLLAFAWHFHARGYQRATGTTIGLAAAVKVFPVLLGLYLFARAPRALIWAAIAGVAALALPLALMGPDTLRVFMEHSNANVSYWETFPAVTYSLHGLLARLLIGGEWARPLVHAPLAARVLGMLSALVLLAIAVKALRGRDGSDGHEGARFGAWMAVLVMLNPLAMAHTGVILALPILLVAQALHDDERAWPRLAWAAGVFLVSIPGHTLIFLASQPIEPWQGGLLIALPLWGTLSLFAAAVAAASPRTSLSIPVTPAPAVSV
jgi:hypothetical protein